MKLEITTPKWAYPLNKRVRYKGAKGGRSGGKSHHMAQLLILNHLRNPNHQTVCIREVQKSLKHSSKKTIENKIRSMGVEHLFDIKVDDIRSKVGTGVFIFTGLSDVTAESIKSLEGFDTAFIDEAQMLTKKSLEILLPTIRKKDSELLFSWNPQNEDDAVEKLFAEAPTSNDMTLVECNYLDNPFVTQEILVEAERHRRINPDTFDNVWLGAFSIISEAQIFKGKFVIRDFELHENKFTDSPLFGLDFGFSQDPTAGVKIYIRDNILYIRNEAGRVGLELNDTPQYLKDRIPDIENYVIRADNSRPESVSLLRKGGLPFCESVDKWKGSVEDGIEFIKTFDNIVIHSDCIETAKEFRLYSYKIDKRTGDILPTIEDKNNHYMDALRYALAPIIKDGVSFNYGAYLD